MTGLLLLGWAIGVASVSARAIAGATAGGGSFAPAPPPGRSVLLVRPCAGDEPGLEQALLSCREAASLPCAVTVVFALGAEGDAAMPVAERAAAQLRREGLCAEVMITRAPAPNAKSGQIAAVLRARASDDVVIADSDVLLEPGSLLRLLSALAPAEVAASWTPPAERGRVETWGDRSSQALLGASLHAFPLLAGLDPGGMVGKLCAIKRGPLLQVGGFEALGEVLGEDMELARRLRALGFRTVATRGVVSSLASGRSLSAAVARYARWIQVIRAQRPALLLSYPLLLAATPLLLVAAGALALLGQPLAAPAALVALGARGAVAFAAARLVGRPRPPHALLLDALLGDGLLLAALGQALVSRKIVWRGRAFAVGGGGRLQPAAGVALAFALTLSLLSAPLLALPPLGEPGRNVRLEDAGGRVVEMSTLLGKPILIVYEDKGSAQQNQSLKDELSQLARGDKYRGRVALAAIADVSAYNFWPIKGFVKDSIRKESKRFNTTIFCDWTGQIREAYSLKKGLSSIVLLDRDGRVVFAGEGSLSAEARRSVVDKLRALIEGSS